MSSSCTSDSPGNDGVVVLGLQDPKKESVRHLQPSGEQEIWTIEEGRKKVSFLLDDDGRVITRSIDVGTDFPRVVDAVARTD